MKKSIVSNKTLSPMVGDSHRYKTEKGIISMVKPCEATLGTYEIYCIEGNLFDKNGNWFNDVERYKTLEEAEEAINNYLTDKN